MAHTTAFEIDRERSLGERLSDSLTAFGGSWTFICLFLGFMVAWAILNTELLQPRAKAFDPYPYVFLNLMLSMIAALQAPVIMMSQNRQGRLDRIRAEQDYEVNLEAERRIGELHRKIDSLREDEWRELVLMQQRQLSLLERLVSIEPSTTQDPTGQTRMET